MLISTFFHPCTDVNDGARIDYILVDKDFFEAHGRHGSELDGPLDPTGTKDTSSEHAALHMGTAGGLWEPAPYDGSGMAEASRAVYDSQFVEPHTGIIYTPPKYSDHVATSLVLDVDLAGPRLVRTSAVAKTQPHAAQQSIAAMFSSANARQTPGI